MTRAYKSEEPNKDWSWACNDNADSKKRKSDDHKVARNDDEDQRNGWRPAQSSHFWKRGDYRSEGKWHGDKAAWTDGYWRKHKEPRDSFSNDDVFTHGPDNILGLNNRSPPKLSVDDKREKIYVAMRHMVRQHGLDVRPKSGDANSEGEDPGADSNSDGEDSWLSEPPMQSALADSGLSPETMDGVQPSQSPLAQ